MKIKNSTNCWICDNVYVDSGVKVRDHCHITGKYGNHKIPVVFHNLKNYHSHLIMQELSKFNFEINVTPN